MSLVRLIRGAISVQLSDVIFQTLCIQSYLYVVRKDGDTDFLSHSSDEMIEHLFYNYHGLSAELVHIGKNSTAS